MRLILGYIILGLCVASTNAEGLSIGVTPSRLPADLSLGEYSPLLRIDYSGLKTGQVYTLRSWLLVPGPWYCASSVWCNRSISIDNIEGDNDSGSLWLPVDTDIYSYSRYDWVFRLYNESGSQVAWKERYISSTSNRPPILAPIGNRDVIAEELISFSLSGFDPENQGLNFGADNLPDGAEFDAANGIFKWTPSEIGTVGPVVFWVQDSGEGALADAEVVWFTVLSVPSISQHPSSQALPVGENVTFSVEANSGTPMSYQWRFAGDDIVGATEDSLTINNISKSSAGGYSVAVANDTGTHISREAVLTVYEERSSVENLERSMQWLRDQMDEPHRGIQVYTDISAGGNHFHARGQLPNELSAVEIFGSATTDPRSGATCIKNVFENTSGPNFGGFYFLNGYLVEGAPLPYFGENVVPGTSIAVNDFTGLDLRQATRLSFWARGETGGEVIEFFMGGVGRDPDSGAATQPFPDSTSRRSIEGVSVTLSDVWVQYFIDLTGTDLSNVMGGFGWIANDQLNPQGATFYLDDIEYELSQSRQEERYEEPRFIRSFATRPTQPDISDGNLDDDIDLVLRNVAFTYDNALAILAFLAEGSPDSDKRAAIICDAMLYGMDNDRYFNDGRLRTAYQSGEIALPAGWIVNGRAGTATIPGFYLEDPPRFVEVENQDVDTGNNAWGMIAFIAAYRELGDSRYLEGARRIGAFIESVANYDGDIPGFRGGYQNAETEGASPRTYASTEHNLDVYAAFTEMYGLTGEQRWKDGADLALRFVEAMWDEENFCFLTGTTGGAPDARNEIYDQLPLDTQTWGVLAVPNSETRQRLLLACAEEHHRCQSDGFDGVDFNSDRDGVWFEGTAQLAVAYGVAGDWEQLAALRETLDVAQQIPWPYGDGYGIPAAAHDGVTTGFSFKLFRRPHLGATSWNVFAQIGYNPYYGVLNPALTRLLGISKEGIELKIYGQPGKTHELESSSDLSDWKKRAAIEGTDDGEMLFTDSEGLTQKAIFYRTSKE